MGVAGRRAAARRGDVAGRGRASLRGRRAAAAPVDLRLALDPLPHHGAEARRGGGRSGPPVPPRREPAEQRTPYRRGPRGVTPLGRAPPVLRAERFRVLRPPRRRGALVRGDSVLVLATRGLVSALETWKAILLFLVLNAVLAAAFLHPLASALHTTLDKSPWAERLSAGDADLHTFFTAFTRTRPDVLGDLEKWDEVVTGEGGERRSSGKAAPLSGFFGTTCLLYTSDAADE